MCVFVLDKRKNPLMPCSQRRARVLLERGRAVVHRHHPFTIRLRDRVGGETQPVELRIDPGSKGTGIAVVWVAEETSPETGELETVVHVLERVELRHRGAAIRKALLQRSQSRRRRRSANLRYRAPRLSNRRRPKGWLPPSLRHRADTTATGRGPNGERTQRKLGAVAAQRCVRLAPRDGYGYVKEVQP